MYGLIEVVLKWFTNYLHIRKQKVKYNNVRSEALEIKYRVPQGIILGPLLFIISVNFTCLPIT